MKRPILYIIIAAALLAGCGHDADMPSPSPDGTDKPMIFGSVSGDAASPSQKSLIGSDGKPLGVGEEYLADLCDPAKGGNAIAIWGDYCPNDELASSSRPKYVQIFSRTPLRCDTSDGGEGWYYDPVRYWFDDCSYRFRAYYPSVISPVTSSDISTLSLEYFSNNVQQDLCIAYNEADSGAEGFDPAQAVELYFRHTLAALRICFQLDYETSDVITSCWFENTEKEDFAVSGILFCERRESGGRIFTSAEPPKELESEAYFQWLEGYCPAPVYDRFYEWKCTYGADGEPNGLPIATVLNETTGELDPIEKAYAYDSNAESTAKGDTFIGNGGWLLIMPQTSSGKLQLCFTTKHGGESAVFRVNIPKNTGPVIDDDGDYVDADGHKVPTAAQAAQYDRWRAGKRYTYTVKIRRSDLQLSLAVADWNMRYSSTQIEF